MGTPFIGELKIFSFDFAPRGWAACDGQLIPINQNQALFSLIGYAYGGDDIDTVNFALPNFQGRVPVNIGGSYKNGNSGGEETHTLTGQEIPMHRHQAQASSGEGSERNPDGAIWATQAGVRAYSNDISSSGTPMGNVTSPPETVGHNNLQPYLTLNFCIALQGLVPQRS
jgi:microcystin-dependent protein